MGDGYDQQESNRCYWLMLTSGFYFISPISKCLLSGKIMEGFVMTIIFTISVAISLFSEGFGYKLSPLIFASIYGTFSTILLFSSGLNKDGIFQKVNEEWESAEKIEKFIDKYSSSIKYFRSAQKRGRNLSVMAVFSFFMAGYFFYLEFSQILIFWALFLGFYLWYLGNKANKALFYVKYFPRSEQAKLACVSFLLLWQTEPVAMKLIKSSYLPEKIVRDAIYEYARDPVVMLLKYDY